MKIKFNFILLFILIINIHALYPAPDTNSRLQKFKITAVSDKRKVPLNQQFNVTVSVSYIGEPGDYMITDPYVEQYHNLELVGNSSESLVKSMTNNSNLKEVIKNYTFILKPQSMGQAYFPVVRITVSDLKGNLITELSTQPIPVFVDEPVIKRNYTLFFIILITIVILLAGGSIIINALLKQKKKKEEKKRLEQEQLKNTKTPEQEFQEEFNGIQNLKEMEKLSSAVHIFKKYLNKKFNYNFKDKPTNEIINYFKKKKILKEEIINILQDILTGSDFIKFAAEKPDLKKVNNILDNIKKSVNSIQGGLQNEQGNQGNQ